MSRAITGYVIEASLIDCADSCISVHGWLIDSDSHYIWSCYGKYRRTDLTGTEITNNPGELMRLAAQKCCATAKHAPIRELVFGAPDMWHVRSTYCQALWLGDLNFKEEL